MIFFLLLLFRAWLLLTRQLLPTDRTQPVVLRLHVAAVLCSNPPGLLNQSPVSEPPFELATQLLPYSFKLLLHSWGLVSRCEGLSLLFP